MISSANASRLTPPIWQDQDAFVNNLNQFRTRLFRQTSSGLVFFLHKVAKYILFLICRVDCVVISLAFSYRLILYLFAITIKKGANKNLAAG